MGISQEEMSKMALGTAPEADSLAWAERVEMLWAPTTRPGSAPHGGDDQSGWTSAPSPAASQARRCCCDFL